MSAQTKLAIFALLILATALEVSGDAVVRVGLGQRAAGAKALYFLAGAAILFGYGLALNLAPIEFSRVVGVYVAILFVLWQIISFIAFRSVPTTPMLVGGALIVAGGLVVAFWGSADVR
jgi:small multidrug resistance family-3 protein